MHLSYLLGVLAGIFTLGRAAGQWQNQEPMQLQGPMGYQGRSATYFQITAWPYVDPPTVQHALDLAQSHVQWVLTRGNPSGNTLVSILWDPSRSEFWASTVPKGLRIRYLVEGRNDAGVAPWRAAADPYMRLAEGRLYPLLHAEDNIAFEYCVRHPGNIQNGRFPEGTFTISYIDHGPNWRGAPAQRQEPYPPCGHRDFRREGCVGTAVKLGIIPWDGDIDEAGLQFLPEPLPQASPPPVIHAGGDDDDGDDDSDDSSEDQYGYMSEDDFGCGPSAKARRDLLKNSVMVDEHNSDQAHHEGVTQPLQDVKWKERDVGGAIVSILDTTSTTTPTFTSTISTLDGATLLNIDGVLAWSYTSTFPQLSSCELIDTLSTVTPTISPNASEMATAIGSSAIVSSLTFKGDPPCTFSDSPEATAGACVCTNGATISESMSDGQPCPWPTLPIQALAAQAAATTANAAAKRAAVTGAGVPTTLVTQTVAV